ncbi:hypothetical protein [Mesorhizobium sp. WSM4982]|uniref:hypothetical protein n=1 Tax=Mesorhizobium sp. WSM4982 TaxID=3038550 RepID=UPI0024158C43|nr:hypothetical protein [Mesorhizobium sp. WSM4982]
MKRVNLIEYFELAEELHVAKRNLSSEGTVKGGLVWVSTSGLSKSLYDFANDDNGFSTSKTVARDLSSTIAGWIDANLMDGSDSPPTFSTDNFDKDFHSWQLSAIRTKIDTFRSVFAAECAEVDVYSVGQISLYKTSDLVSSASKTLPAEIRASIPFEAAVEFDDAGRCLAFGLPTACGFHALRGLELAIDGYLRAFGVTKKMNSWNDYVTAAKDLAEGSADKKPAKKVVQMIDRMRDLDRNPLMHPRDTLDEIGADMLFRSSAITVYEIVKDMKANGRTILGVDAPEGAVIALSKPKEGDAAA